jgi:hypothetical protein
MVASIIGRALGAHLLLYAVLELCYIRGSGERKVTTSLSADHGGETERSALRGANVFSFENVTWPTIECPQSFHIDMYNYNCFLFNPLPGERNHISNLHPMTSHALPRHKPMDHSPAQSFPCMITSTEADVFCSSIVYIMSIIIGITFRRLTLYHHVQ